MLFGNSHDRSRNAMTMAVRETPEGRGGDSPRNSPTSATPPDPGLPDDERAASQVSITGPIGGMVMLRNSPGLMLYVVVPLLFMALPLALFRVTVGPGTSLVLALYLWGATVMVGWLAAALGSAVVHRLLAPLRPPLWVITLSGALLSALLLRQPIIEILDLAASLQSTHPPGGEPVPLAFSLSFASQFLQKLAPGTLAWMLANHVFDRLLGIPRYRYPAQTSPKAQDQASVPRPADAPEGPAADLRQPLVARPDLVALRSNDHYVRIITDTGELLTFARLGDAIALAHPITGLQVHRTCWVADRAIRGFRRTGHTGILNLSNGTETPVSRTHVRAVEQRLSKLGIVAGGASAR